MTTNLGDDAKAIVGAIDRLHSTLITIAIMWGSWTITARFVDRVRSEPVPVSVPAEGR